MNDISRNNWEAMTDDRILKQIGVFVKHHRMQQNKTQAVLAEDAGISRSTLSLLERGETVTVATLIRVLRVLDQLQIMDVFVITQHQSPLALAKAEKKKRQRVALPKKKKTDNENIENIDW
ncbi:MAG: helix-turn-helix transcriptional regulator [Dysgonamonadaceae bacterium]|nr:helix-turn-helix transcriptional regulator [Dysgonamonadaceae bacterium]MDD3309889.1 helix-turn-helix transcriptional regulator [Dysgonamonadaceae bacterium]MDD3901162.1 helix-turn-helix transcriptional regulator [Dysgonamonadaceae bacterium]MDD4399484.1 helix-turn-helix transcriptional regulator [Dysgonamonadaceae bacterium]MEA5082298.1 helix-turn-helix transcriptional regulator [Dysgonamonadaceae bacterium]